MAKDFRASQIQTTQIISSGSSGTNAKIVVYPVEKQSTSSPNQGVIDPAKFSTGSIGNDIFLYVSGGIGERNLASGSITVFGGDVHISGNLTSDQQQFENLFRLGLVDYATTIQTSSNPEIVGQVIFPADEFSGSLTLRAILASTEVWGVSTIKLFNISSLSYVDIAGPSQQELAVTGTTPTQVESVDLFTAAGFNTTASNFYELQCFSSADSNIALVGGAELRPSGTFTAQTIITSSNIFIFISGTWIDGGGKLRTTASVAVDGAGGFADNVGSDVYFFVSGTFGSGSSGDAVSVFGGDVRISGTLAVGTSSIFIDNDSISFTTPSASLAYSSSFVLAPFSASQNSSIAGVRIYGGDGGGTATSQRDGGYVEIYTGTGSNSVNPVQAGHGGAFRVVGGKGGNSGTGFGGDGGNIIFTAGSGGNSTNTAGGKGGGFQFIGGAGGSGLSSEHGGSFTFVGGHRGSTSNARGGGFTFRMGNGSSLSNNNSRDGDFIVSGAGNFGSRVSLESIQKISIGLANGVTSTSTGSDTWVYVSGAVNGKGTSAGRMVTYGGSVHISGNLTVDGAAPGNDLWQSTTNELTFNTGSIEITGSALIKNTILVLSEGLSLSGGLTSFSSPSGVIGLPYQGFIRTQLHPSDNGAWRTVIGYGDLNSIGIPIENVLFLGDGSSAGNGWINWSDENLFLALNTTGSAFLTPNGFTIAGADLAFASGHGSDVFFHVSGAKDSLSSAIAGASVFGGDVHISGNIIAGPTLFLSQGLTTPDAKITTKTSGVLAIPYGGQIFGRDFDNDDWNGILAWSDDLLGTGRRNVLHVLGDQMVVVGASGEVLILDSTSGSHFTANIGLSVSPDLGAHPSDIGSDVYFYVSGATGGTDTISRSISVFGGDLNVSGNLIYGHSNDALAQRIFVTSSTTGSEVVKAMSYSLNGNKLYDFDFTILAVGTGSGITKRFKRNLSVAAFDSPFILENTVFVTVPDVTGSAAADVLDVAFEVSSSNLLVYVSGTTSQSVTWQVRGEITKQSS